MPLTGTWVGSLLVTLLKKNGAVVVGTLLVVGGRLVATDCAVAVCLTGVLAVKSWLNGVRVTENFMIEVLVLFNPVTGSFVDVAGVVVDVSLSLGGCDLGNVATEDFVLVGIMMAPFVVGRFVNEDFVVENSMIGAWVVTPGRSLVLVVMATSPSGEENFVAGDLGLIFLNSKKENPLLKRTSFSEKAFPKAD